MGGLGRLGEALLRAASRVGVDVRTGAEVAAVEAEGHRVQGVRLADGERLAAGVVVANVDAVHLYRDLLVSPSALRSVRRARPSGSGFVVLAGVRGRTPGVAHHNVWFSPSYHGEYAALDAGRVSDEPTVYACVSSVTDPSQAPAGDENWFLLVNVPPGGWWDDSTSERYRDVVLARLAERGVDLRGRLAFSESITPADLESRYRAEGGSIYGTSSDGRRAAFVRPGNRSPVRGLYLVGGSSHPGGGLPLVAISGRIVADAVREDGW
jgi:phytoene desaturase